MKKIIVKMPETKSLSYPIYIGNGLLGGILDSISEQLPGKSKYIVTDSNIVAAGHIKTVDPDGKLPCFVIDPPGEKSKYISTVVKIIEDMESRTLGRDSVIIAVGGGTVGDIAGFAAAIFKRGIDIIHLPTTTVSQADSSIGGKTGVDSTLSKNAFGAFHQPIAVYIDVATLKTLDDRQYRAGLVESVKHGLIADAGYFEFIENNLEKILERNSDTLEIIAEKNCTIKTAVVENDPTEKNQRRILNYGHTIGHAIESASNFDLLHGESIAIGIIAAALIEIELGIADRQHYQRIKALLDKLNMPTKIPAEYAVDVIIEHLKRDKKAVKGWPKFVLLDRIGNARCVDGQWAHDVPRELVVQVLEQLY